jgi:hypothetical protein
MRGADGSYDVQVQLHPRDLGEVRVLVNVHHGEVSIQLNAPDAAARDALRNGLSDLRRQLEDQGLQAGSLEVGSGAAGTRQPDTRHLPAHAEPPEDAPVPAEQPVATPSPAGSTRLDLRM